MAEEILEYQKNTEVKIDNNIIASTNNSNIEVQSAEPDVQVLVNAKNYTIVGDELYIPKRYEDAPQWLRDIIGTVTEESFNQKITELNGLTQTLNQLIVELDVAKNTYTQSIISSNDINERINTAITTLNSSLAQSDATILGIANTKVTPQESLALTIDTLSASIENGAINALVSNIENASVDRDSALANDISLVHSELTGDIEGNATAISGLNTSVTNINNTLTAQATEITNLTTEVNNGTNTWASADSTLENSLRTEITDEGARVESKFAYNSNVNINGVWKKSGFGLTANYVSGSGTKADPYVSEFWIDASRFKFTNSNQTGQVAPFTIDATGATPQITFNGKVSFSNVTNTTGTGSNLLYNSAPKIGSETKGWYVWTNSGMTVNLSAGWDIWKPTGGASVAANIVGTPSIGSVYDVGQSSRFPVIAGSRYEASAYISAHRSNSYVFLVFYDTSGNYAGESSGNIINYAGSSALVNWGRSSVFTTAPGNAATATLIIRSVVTGIDPYCFVANAFTGVASTNQTIASNWSEGSSASVSSSDVVTEINSGLTTTINGGKITTNSITAAQIVTGSISADRLMAGTNSSTVWSGGGLVSQNFNGNPYGNIGSPTQGFRLSSGAAGTETDPNIYGAYIKGSTVDIETLSVKATGYPGNSGRVVKYQKNGYIYMPGYGSGFLASRVCSQSESAIKVEGWYRAATNYLVAYLQYSTDGVNWLNLAVKDAQQYGYQEYFYIYFAELFNPSLVTVTSQVTFRIIGNVGGSASDILISIYNN